MKDYKKRNADLEDSFVFFTADNLTDLISMSKQYPTASNETNMELLRAYRNNGDQDALSLLVKMNIKMLIKIAKKYAQHATSYEILDLVDEGALALIEAANDYDLNSEYKFSTYYVNLINFRIKRELGIKDRIIRNPIYLKDMIYRYGKLYREYEAVNEELDDETAMKELGITKKKLETLKTNYKLQPVSLDAKVNDDDSDSSELSSFVKSKENVSDNVISQMFDKELIIFLKQKLSDYQFYVLMMHVFGKKTFKEIGAEFKVSFEAIEQVEKAAFKIIKERCKNTFEIDYKLPTNLNINQLRGAPINPHDITKYMFYREFLVEKERDLYKLFIKGEYEPDDELFAQMLRVDVEEYLRIKNSLFRKLNNSTEEMKAAYHDFNEAMMKTYGSRIYSIDWDMDLEDLKDNIKYISVLWEGKTYSEVIKSLNKNRISITVSMNNLLKKYFNTANPNYTEADLRKAERDINNAMFRMKKRIDIPLDKLLITFRRNKDAFTDEQYDYLSMKLFNIMPKKEFIKKYPNSNLFNGYGYYLVEKLEYLYFNIANYKELNFTKNKYLQIRQQCINTLSENQVQILDWYFGYKCNKLTVYGIQEKLGIQYEKARDLLNNAKSAAQSIFLSRSGKKILETDYYIPYILDENCDLNDLHRKLLKGYLIDKKSYDELSKEYNLSKHNVSSNILDAIMKIDYYRFNILRKYKYPKRISDRAIGSSKYTVEQRKILLDISKGMSRSEVVEKHNITMKQLETLMIKQAELCHKLMVENKCPTYEQIVKELNIHKAANLLNQEESIVLSYTYGIKCKVNPKGFKIARESFKKIYPKLSAKYNKLLNSAHGKIIGKALGIDHATMDIIDRDELITALRNPRLPITEKERELLCYTYEINNYQYKDLNELAEIFNERSSSIKRRIQRAVVTIKKYENGEIPSTISYELDIENNLRYFPKCDREILISKYRDNLNYEQISKKNNITTNQVEKLVKRLDGYLRDILDEEITPFDFDYYYEVIDTDDFPYYDNKELAKKMFELYFEKRMSAAEIKNELNISASLPTISRTINSLIIATAKRKEGIKKANVYTLDDVLAYYKKNRYTMDKEQRRVYNSYFQKIDNALSNDKDKLKSIPIGPLITADLIRDNNEDTFSFKNTPRNEALEILVKNKKELSDETISTFTSFYDIKGKEYLSNKSQRKILKLLAGVNIGKENESANRPEESITPHQNKVYTKK